MSDPLRSAMLLEVGLQTFLSAVKCNGHKKVSDPPRSDMLLEVSLQKNCYHEYLTEEE